VNVERTEHSQYWDLMRWYHVHVNGEPFLRRFRWIQTPLFAVYTTRIFRDDLDRPPHTHSRAFITIVLTGGYAELVNGTTAREHRRFRPRYIGHRDAHQITRVDGELRTLLLAGWRYRTWVYDTPGGKVDWRDGNDSGDPDRELIR
jgi:hypothetical protein